MKTTEKRIQDMTAKGDFETFGEAKEYCVLHGLSSKHFHDNAFQIAGVILRARQDQDKITRHICVEKATEEIKKHFLVIPDSLKIIISAITNTKAI